MSFSENHRGSGLSRTGCYALLSGPRLQLWLAPPADRWLPRTPERIWR